jgi:hypothetical protein
VHKGIVVRAMARVTNAEMNIVTAASPITFPARQEMSSPFVSTSDATFQAVATHRLTV